MNILDFLLPGGQNASVGPGSKADLGHSAVRYLRLAIEDARLGASEKLTILLSTLAFYGMGAALGLLVLVFVSIGVGHLLADTIAPKMAYIYVACFYVLLFVLMVLFRRQIFINPIARLITRLFVAPPQDPETETDNSRQS